MTENKDRVYYSIRTGKNPFTRQLDIDIVRRLFRDLYQSFNQKYYFQEAFGFECVDAGIVAGSLGTDVEAYLFLHLRKDGLWPISEKCLTYSEDDLFDILEFLFDNISKPVDGYFHSYSGCGWHYNSFDQASGQEEYRMGVNEIIKDYENGYELSEDGEILHLAENGLEDLFSDPLPVYNPIKVENRVHSAIRKFRRYKSSPEDKRDAIRDLADVLEFLRPELSKLLSNNDERELFILANNFGIRHNNPSQKINYDENIWFDWMFYHFLSTITAVMKMINQPTNGR